MVGGLYKCPKPQIFGFFFCPQGPRIAAQHGTSYGGAGDLVWRRRGPRIAAPRDLVSRRQGTSYRGANGEGPRLAAAWTSTRSARGPPKKLSTLGLKNCRAVKSVCSHNFSVPKKVIFLQSPPPLPSPHCNSYIHPWGGVSKLMLVIRNKHFHGVKITVEQ